MSLTDKLIPSQLLAAAVAGVVATAEPTAPPPELPRIPPTPADRALDTFGIKPGFRLELVASEPMVADPIAIAFDGPGRMFVVEMRGYSERRDEKLGRVRLLLDDNGDGSFDRSTVFASGLAWPTGVIAWRGGAFVIASPDILYFADADGDGAAESKEVIFTGFGAGAGRLNVQALPNNLKWGPDGRIHGATAGNAGRVGRPDTTERLELRGLDFSFDPEKLDLRAENGGGQYGLCFDEWGRKFVCSNSNHIQAVLYPRRYSGIGLPPARVGIAADGPAAEVFRTSGDEPWRVVRTRWRVAGKVGGPIEGGGRPSGYFTAATGICIYRGHAFIADAGSNLVHHKALRYPGVQPVAERLPDEVDREFLTSRDNWFRPVQLIPGPDGALYIADMYREVIEHPWSLPPGIKERLDLNSGNDRGRIYRITPDEDALVAPPPPPPELAEILASENERDLDATTQKWLAGLASHPSAAVRFQLALTLALREGNWRIAPLVKILAGSAGDSWLRAAALKALGDLPAEEAVTTVLAGEPDAEALVAIAKFASSSADLDTQNRIVERAAPAATFRVAEALGLREFSAGQRETLLTLIRNQAAGITPERLAAIRISAAGVASDAALELLSSEAPEAPTLQRELLSTLTGGRAEATTLVGSWDAIHSPLQRVAAGWLLAKPDRCKILLESIAAGRIPASAIDVETAESLRSSANPEIRTLASKALAKRVPTPDRAAAIKRYSPALELAGDRGKGRAVFLARCAACHRAGDDGFAFGPDAASFRSAGRESVLLNFLDPNRELAPGYANHIAKLEDGSTLSGTLAGSDAKSVRLRMPGGLERIIPRDTLKSLDSSELSVMPVGLEAGLSLQDVADLLEFCTR